jgi:hypothetical protein
VVGIKRESLLEAPPRPGILLASQVSVSPSDMQFDCVGVQLDAFLEDCQGFIVATFVVEVMGLFVEVVGAEECIRHQQDLPRQVTDKLRNSVKGSKRKILWPRIDTEGDGSFNVGAAFHALRLLGRGCESRLS